MVFTGDIEQIDSPYLDTASNGLSYLSDKMKDQDIFAHVNLVKGEKLSRWTCQQIALEQFTFYS